MMAAGNYRFYAQSEHEFIGCVRAVRLVPRVDSPGGKRAPNLLARARWMPLIKVVVIRSRRSMVRNPDQFVIRVRKSVISLVKF